MQPSPEIREAALQAMRDQLAGNLDAVLQITSQEPEFLSIGTAPGEWFKGVAAFEQAMRAAAAAGGGGMPPLENIEVEAYQEGTVGWGSQRGTLRLPNGVSLAIRGTFVVHQEGGRWKAVQVHNSVAIPDDQIMNIH